MYQRGIIDAVRGRFSVLVNVEDKYTSREMLEYQHYGRRDFRDRLINGTL